MVSFKGYCARLGGNGDGDGDGSSVNYGAVGGVLAPPVFLDSFERGILMLKPPASGALYFLFFSLDDYDDWNELSECRLFNSCMYEFFSDMQTTNNNNTRVGMDWVGFMRKTSRAL